MAIAGMSLKFSVETLSLEITAGRSWLTQMHTPLLIIFL